MVRAKNYETMSTFVKVMQKKLWPLFFRTRCRRVITRNGIQWPLVCSVAVVHILECVTWGRCYARTNFGGHTVYSYIT